MKYRYRWVYSECYGKWYSVTLPSDWTEEQIREEMKYIEDSEGPSHGCRWSGFQYENSD